jgi:catechol 2,3-dioxygenase-like lactoylglutathione lyase family enzyme
VITGAHFLIYSKDADADRAFIRDVLGFRSVEAGEGWPIFALPASELAVHPGDGDFTQEHADHEMLGIVLYLMCDDVHAIVKSLQAKKVTCAAVDKAPWGLYTVLRLPSGGSIGLYQPTHPTAIGAI